MTIVTAVEDSGNEIHVGSFDQGVVVEDNKIIDCATRETLLVRWINGKWVSNAEAELFQEDKEARHVPTKFFSRVHVQ